MKKISTILLALIAFSFTACQDKDIDVTPMVLQAINADEISGSLQGDDYTWTWPQLPAEQSMQVNIYEGSTMVSSETVTGNTYTHHQVQTNVPFVYVFKISDGTNLSSGAVKHYMREGATQISGLAMAQIEKSAGYDASVTWNKAVDASTIEFTATNGTKTIQKSLPGTTTSYTIEDVVNGENWTVILRAVNEKGSSMATTGNLKIGKTAVAFLSTYATPEELIAKGDDDEASAWLWMHETYPNAQFLPFAKIKSTETIEPFRVLFWLRDLEGVGEDAVWNMPTDVAAATPFIKKWYMDGGSMLLWSHATVYAGVLGRLNIDDMKSNDHTIGTNEGGVNNDTWKMAVGLNPGGRFSKDASSHPIFKGLAVESNDRTKLIAFKGPGWTEDHNCLFFNLPSLLTGLGNQEEACYTQLTQTYGIYPLGTWDSQIDWVSQLNVWEAQQGNTEFKGTLLCIGNGGCEFSMKNADGTPDKSAHPKNNSYQDNVLRLAKNAIEYLKTR